MLTAPQFEDQVSMLANGGLYVMMRDHWWQQIENNADPLMEALEREEWIQTKKNDVDMELESIFTLDTIEEHMDSRWDLATQSIITPDDEGLIENLEDIDKDPYTMHAAEQENVAPKTGPGKLPMGFQAGDASVLSIGTQGTVETAPVKGLAQVNAIMTKNGITMEMLKAQFTSIQNESSGTQDPAPTPQHNEATGTGNPLASDPAGNCAPAAAGAVS